MANPKKPEFFEIGWNILGYKAEGEWVALALEMDLRGYGKTWDEALANLRDLALMQIGFARFKRQPEMIFKPADPVWFQLFAEVRRAKFEEAVRAGTADRSMSDYQTGALPIPSAHLIAKIQKNFTLADA